jgi:hypothetical protein
MRATTRLERESSATSSCGWSLLPKRCSTPSASLGSDTLDGTAVEWIPARETSEHPVELAVDAGGRPVALRVERGGSIGTLLIRWSSWKRVQGVHLPFAVEIAQGRDVYRFRFREPSLRPPADAG